MNQAELDEKDEHHVSPNSYVSSTQAQGHLLHLSRASWKIYDYKTGARTRLVVHFLCGSGTMLPNLENPSGELCKKCAKKLINTPPADLQF